MHTDEELARDIQRGSMEAFTLLVDRYYSPLFGYLYRMCGGVRALSEDMVQETFLKLLRGISLYQPSRPFKPYLYAIAANIARNHHQRADTRLTQSITDTADDDYYDEHPSAEESVIADEAAKQVLWALAQLPDHQREVVVLFYYQELSQKDIAEALHIPVGTVKSRLSLGLRRLRDLIATMESER